MHVTPQEKEELAKIMLLFPQLTGIRSCWLTTVTVTAQEIISLPLIRTNAMAAEIA